MAVSFGLFRGKTDSAPANDSSRIAPNGTNDDALDTVAALLRTWGRLPLFEDDVDREIVAAECEGWAIHALNGAPPPGSDPDALPTPTREWIRMRGYAASLREREHRQTEELTGVVTDLREVVLTFAQTVSSVFDQEEAAEAILQGELGKLKSALSSSSLDELRRSVASSVVAISHLAEERKQRQMAQLNDLGTRLNTLNDELQDAKRAGQRDALTALYNRASFDDRLNRTASLRHLYDSRACLALIDLDNFKWVNDKFGHPAGDTTLRALADLLGTVFARKTDVVARYGGDEFAAILSETASDDACRLGGKLVKAAREMIIQHDGQPIHVTVSVGIAEIGRSEAPAAWLDRADKALYQAKRAGRDRMMLADR